MMHWFKNGIVFKTTAPWLISSLFILYKAELTIAGSPDSASTFPVNFSIPRICTRGSEMWDPSQRLILKFQNLAKAGSLHEEAGCTNLSVVTNCHISGTVSRPGTYRLYSSHEGEEFKECNRSFHVPVEETTTQLISIKTSLMNTSPKSTTIEKLMTTRPLTKTRRVFTTMSRLSTTLPAKTTTRSTPTVGQSTTIRTPGTSYLATGTGVQTTLSILFSTTMTRLTTTLQLATTVVTPTAATHGPALESKSKPLKIPLIGGIGFMLVCGIIAIFASKRYRRKRRSNKQITAVDEDAGDTHDHQSENTGNMDRDSVHIYAEIQQIQHENYHVGEEFELQELTESDDYEHLRHSSKKTSDNAYDTLMKNSSFAPTGKMKRSVSSGNRPDSGYVDMTFCSRDTHKGDQN